MAQIDKLTQRMAQNQVTRALLVNNQPMRLIVAGRETTTPTNVTLATLQAMVQEVIPANLAAQLNQDGSFQFPYQSADGLYIVSVQRNNGTLQVILSPFAPVVASPTLPRPPVSTPLFVDDASTQPIYSPPSLRAPTSPPLQPRISNSFDQLKIPLLFAAALILALGVGLTLRSGKQGAQRASQATQVSGSSGITAYQGYKTEIGKLSEAGLKINRIPGDEGGEDYVIASPDQISYNAIVEDLQKRVKADSSVEGTETLGAKADLLNLVKAESTQNPPITRAMKINEKAGQRVWEHFSLHGKDALKFKGVQSVVMTFKGIEGLASLNGCKDGDMQACARTLMAPPLLPRN